MLTPNQYAIFYISDISGWSSDFSGVLLCCEREKYIPDDANLNISTFEVIQVIRLASIMSVH